MRLTLRRPGEPELPDDLDSDRAVGPDADDGTDWRAVGVFSAGIAIGAALGAGLALLLAPASGFETRARLMRGARHSRDRAADRWDAFEQGLRRGARRSRRNLERRLTLARWRTQDAWERKRYPER